MRARAQRAELAGPRPSRGLNLPKKSIRELWPSPSIVRARFPAPVTAVATALLTSRMACHAASYELTVYSDDLPSPGEAELETIVSLAKPRVGGPLGARRVAQAQGELSYGLGSGWAVGLQVPAVYTRTTLRVQGAAIELQYVAPHDTAQGWYRGARAEVGRQSSVYEDEAEASLEFNPLLGYRLGNVHLVFNPSLEVPLHSEGARVNFQPSMKTTWQMPGRSALGFEYYGIWGSVWSLRSVAQRDETLYAVCDTQFSFGRVNFGLGRGLHPRDGSVDPWVAKVGVQLDLD